MNWEEFALKILPILQQVLQVLDHATPEGRHLLAAHRSRLLVEIRQMQDALKPPPAALEPPPKPPAKAETKEAAKPEAKAAAKESAKADEKDMAKSTARDAKDKA